MPFETAFKAHLQGDAAIVALVGERVHPQPVPQGATKPVITYLIVGDDPATDLDGEDGEMSEQRVQVDCWAANHDDVKRLKELVRIRMKTAAASFHAIPVAGAGFSAYEQVTKLHRFSRDFLCFYRIT